VTKCLVCGRTYGECPCPPYSAKDYDDAKKQGLDLDNWNDYVKYYGVGEEPNYDDM